MCKVDLHMWSQQGRAASFGARHRWKKLHQSSPVIFCVLPWFVFLYVTLLSFTVISWNGSQPISDAFFGGRAFFVLICFLFFFLLTSLFPMWSQIPLVLFSSPRKLIFVSFPCRNTSLLVCHTDTGRQDLSLHLGAALLLLPSLITDSSQQQSSWGRNSHENNSGTKLGSREGISPALHCLTASWEVNSTISHSNDLWASVCIKSVL